MRTTRGQSGSTVRAAVLAMLALVAAGAPAPAADLFTVTGIDVRAEADSASAAQFKARAQGRAEAFRKLLQRLTPREHWQSLPTPPAEELEGFQDSLDVVKEHTNRNLYIATLDYHFSAQAVRDFLKTQGVPFSDSQASTVLLLPLYETSGKRMLWEEENPWAKAWADRRLVHELVPLKYPLGDLADIAAINTEGALSAQWQDVAGLASRYDAGEVIIAHGVLQRGDTNRLYLRAHRLSPDGPGTAIETSVSAGGLEQLFDKAIDALVNRLNENWKQNTLVSYDTEREIDASVRFSSLENWVKVRKGLADVATVVEMRTVAVSAQGAEIVVRFAGTPSQLALNLRQKQLYLAAVDGRWQIGYGRSPQPEQDFLYGETPPVRIIDSNESSPNEEQSPSAPASPGRASTDPISD
ncbi:MAG: DUF2066 domain-containing protein [Alphaproteobacteria bacterium]